MNLMNKVKVKAKCNREVKHIIPTIFPSSSKINSQAPTHRKNYKLIQRSQPPPSTALTNFYKTMPLHAQENPDTNSNPMPTPPPPTQAPIRKRFPPPAPPNVNKPLPPLPKEDSDATLSFLSFQRFSCNLDTRRWE